MKKILGFIFLIIGLCFNFAAAYGENHAVVKVAFTSLRSQPRHSSEMLTQAVMGQEMEVLADTTADWLTVRLSDGYPGFINRSAVKVLSPEEEALRQDADFVIATSILPQEFVASDSSVLCRIEAGTILERSDESFRLPDGREGMVAMVTEQPDTLPSRNEVFEAARQLIGIPYLWGGNTAAALDCSGLIRLCFSKFGWLTPRDASQLFACGPLRPENEAPQLADLLFFSTRPDGPITHVAFYAGDGNYLHCSGEVKISRMSPEDEDFSKRFYRGCLDWTRGQAFSPIVSRSD